MAEFKATIRELTMSDSSFFFWDKIIWHVGEPQAMMHLSCRSHIFSSIPAVRLGWALFLFTKFRTVLDTCGCFHLDLNTQWLQSRMQSRLVFTLLINMCYFNLLTAASWQEFGFQKNVHSLMVVLFYSGKCNCQWYRESRFIPESGIIGKYQCTLLY